MSCVMVEINEILHAFSIKFDNPQGSYCISKGLVISLRGLSIDRNMFCKIYMNNF